MRSIKSSLLLLITMIGFLIPSQSISQRFSLSFDSILTISRETKEKDIRINIKTANNRHDIFRNYTLSVYPDLQQSSLSPLDYYIYNSEKVVSTLDSEDSSRNAIFIKLKADSTPERDRILVLKFRITKSENNNTTELAETEYEGKFKQITITIKGIQHALDTLKSFNYLAYVGTNFDMIDGPKAKNIFFATNVFLPPLRKKAVGVYLSLYGNRTMSTTDSFQNAYRTKLIPLTDTSHYNIAQRGNIERIQVSDNIGAFISPIIKLGGASSRSSEMQLYYTPSLEFVWRRTTNKSTYLNYVGIDTLIEQGRISREVFSFEDLVTQNANEFVFNVGLIGLMLVHENNSISVRVQASVGWSFINSPISTVAAKEEVNSHTTWYKSDDCFFSGRAWITEPSTGITLQAEITNTLKTPRPFYGITLSKAISFNGLGKIFQPLVSKGG